MSYATVETEAQYEARKKSQVNFGHPAVQSVLAQNEGMEDMPLVNLNE